MNLLAMNKVTVGTTPNTESSPQTLARLGITINSGLARLLLRTSGYVEYGMSSDTTQMTDIPKEGISIPITAVTAAGLYFRAANVPLTVIQFG